MLSFFVVAYAIWLLLHFYVARRAIAPLPLGRVGHGVLYGLLFVLGASSFFAPLSSRLVPPYDAIYRWPAWIYFGAFTIFFALIAGRDAALWLRERLLRVRANRRGETHEPTSHERRRFLLNASGGAAVGVTGVIASWGAVVARRRPEIVQVEVPIKDLPHEFDGYHIVQLSDVHVGETIDKDFILPIVEQVTSLSPDLVVLTGDLVDGTVPSLRADVSPLSYLRAPDGVWCVTGNHEYYNHDAPAWCEHFRSIGVTPLINEHTLIQRGNGRLLLAGVTDLLEGKKVPGHTSDPELALAGAAPHDVRILLAHQPRSAHRASKLGYQLQLSGHTHGGQFFPWNLLIGLTQPLSAGLGKIDDMWLYVNRGTCYWGPPNRAGVPAEVTSMRLKRV